MRHFPKLLGFVLVLALLQLSCANRIYEVAYPTLNDGKYDSEFPYRNCSKELQKVVNTVKKVNCTAYYEAYTFPLDAKITRDDLDKGLLRKYEESKYYYSSSVSGTATVLYFRNNRVGLLTCAHIVDFPDTAIVYDNSPGQPRDRYIHSVSFKTRQSNYIAELPDEGDLEILAMDKQLDAAILGMQLPGTSTTLIPVLDYPVGKAKELEWGSFVYLIGYPIGYKMITKGIVSNPNRDRKGAFLVDALFNEGFSGGIVLAVKDGVPNFELVGMAKAVSVSYENYLAPGEDTNRDKFDPYLPYEGPVYVQVRKEINYGITHVISMESIVDFIKDNHRQLAKAGYDFTSLIK